jgi:hypothetical protein
MIALSEDDEPSKMFQTQFMVIILTTTQTVNTVLIVTVATIPDFGSTSSVSFLLTNSFFYKSHRYM